MQNHNGEKKISLVVGIGELLWDLLPEGRRLGGAPANFTYHAARQGLEAYAVTLLSNTADFSFIRRVFVRTSEHCPIFE